MPVTAWLPAVAVDAVWLCAGLFLGITAVVLWQRLTARRADRLSEWDPY